MLIYRNICYFIFVNVIPLVILSVLTTLLVRALHRANTRRLDMTQGQLEKDPAITLTLIVVVIVFLLCQIPAAFNRLFIMLYNSGTNCDHWHYWFRKVSDVLIATNSAVNFFIYMTCSSRFRQKYKNIFLCQKSRSPNANSGLTSVRTNRSLSTSVNVGISLSSLNMVNSIPLRENSNNWFVSSKASPKGGARNGVTLGTITAEQRL